MAWKGAWKEAVGLQVEEKVVEWVLEAQTSMSLQGDICESWVFLEVESLLTFHQA